MQNAQPLCCFVIEPRALDRIRNSTQGQFISLNNGNTHRIMRKWVRQKDYLKALNNTDMGLTNQTEETLINYIVEQKRVTPRCYLVRPSPLPNYFSKKPLKARPIWWGNTNPSQDWPLTLSQNICNTRKAEDGRDIIYSGLKIARGKIILFTAVSHPKTKTLFVISRQQTDIWYFVSRMGKCYLC